MSKEVVIVGYSGHALVVIDTLKSMGFKIKGYCETSKKEMNPYGIDFLGSENEVVEKFKKEGIVYIVAIGDNNLREKVQGSLEKFNVEIVNAIHNTAVISTTVKLGIGILISPGAIINSMAQIGNGTICNSSSVIEHECVLGDYVHIGPGTVLCGNVRVGNNTLIGAGSVVIPNITIGKNVIIGAGSVVVKDVPDNTVIKRKSGKVI
ncbi:MAG: acetyltransferase [Sphingobacteriaceae bacterium]|nr:acetyltransferase [Sphingobacteriaceae bacterium]